jgi:nicotinamide phosphoribosyltransferase
MTNKINPMLMTDFYKTIHHRCYAPGTTETTFYWTARHSRDGFSDGVVFFGLHEFLKKLVEDFDAGFFKRRKQDVINEYKEFITVTLGADYADTKHIEALYDLGCLPLTIKALPEGMVVPIGCPMVEISNTHPEFFWLPGYFETLLSCNLWFPITSATTARKYRTFLEMTYKLAGEPIEKVDFACSDFSMRGMTSLESATMSGSAHLLFFKKTANMPAVDNLIKYYHAHLSEFENAGTPSTEHSVMSSFGMDETRAYMHLLREFPRGPLSIVSDTYNLWNVIDVLIPELKKYILAREGTTIIRPDSGDPVKIICGDDSEQGTAKKGVVEALWDEFGGTTNAKGYKVLDSHVKVIYGDAITLDRCKVMCEKLMEKGFSPVNVVFGIGSYTYQYVTRDTYSFKFGCTHAVINGKDELLYKDPFTDKDKIKKSLKGLIIVYRDSIDGSIKYKDGFTRDGQRKLEDVNLMRSVFFFGGMHDLEFKHIRKRCLDGI